MPARRVLAVIAIVALLAAFVVGGVAAALFAGRLLTPHAPSPAPAPSPTPTVTATAH